MYYELVQGHKRPSRELIDQFEGIWPSVLSDAMGRHGAMGPFIRRLFDGTRLLGSAVTVVCFPGDNLTVHKALQILQDGDVLIVDDGGAHNTSIMGHNMSLKAKNKGCVGLVTNGVVRDVELLRSEDFPVFCSGVCPRSPQKHTFGAVNVPVEVGGIVVRPGDIVSADADGVVVVPLDQAQTVVQASRERMEMERQQADDVRAGREPLEIMWGAAWVDERLGELYRETNHH